MASQAYYDWLDAGEPYTTARPAAKVAANIRRHGYTVYEIGNTSHMQAVPPEDHTPFSATGWPNASPRWWGHAIDIMPPSDAMVESGLPTLAQLAQQIHDDKQAGVKGATALKYMNWEPDGPGGKCVHCSWQSSHASTGSTDRGHIHASFRSDKTQSSEADDYDPVQRWKDGQMTPEQVRDAVWGKDDALDSAAYPWRTDSPSHKPPGTNKGYQGQTGLAEAAQRAEAARSEAAAARAVAEEALAVAKEIRDLLKVSGGGEFEATGTITLTPASG